MDNSVALTEATAITSSQRWDVDERYPIVFARADGPYAWDVEGNRYLDLTSASGAAPLGARHPGIRDSLLRAVDELGGSLPGTISLHRTAVARRLTEIFPAGERVLFMRTGSCATAAAIRLARAATGRRSVFTSGFHGWHDWALQARTDPSLGTAPDIVEFGYSLSRLERSLQTAGEAPAAVIVTPEPAFFPEPYYAELERIVRGSQAVLIYDEVMAGFRYGAGGFHGVTGGAPDLVTVSKGLANGMALSAVVGRATVMDAQEHTYLGNTYLREVTPFAVAEVSVSELTDGGGIDAMNARGGQLRDGLNTLFVTHGVPARAVGPAAMFDVVFHDQRCGELLYRRLREHGMLLDPGKHMTSAVTTAAQIDEVLTIADRILGELVRDGDITVGTGGEVPFETLASQAKSAINADTDELAKWN